MGPASSANGVLDSRLLPTQAMDILREVAAAVAHWARVGQRPEVGMSLAQLKPFEEAFVHAQADAAHKLATAG